MFSIRAGKYHLWPSAIGANQLIKQSQVTPSFYRANKGVNDQ